MWEHIHVLSEEMLDDNEAQLEISQWKPLKYKMVQIWPGLICM